MAAAVWAAAVVFGVLAALDRVNPKLVALVVALVAAFVGAVSRSMDPYEHLGPALAACTTAVVVVYSLRQGMIVLLGLSLLGFLIAVTVLIETVFSGIVAGLVAALLGLSIVVVAVFEDEPRPPSRRLRRTSLASRTSSAELASSVSTAICS